MYTNSYSSYLGANKCCSLKTQGGQGPQGTQGKKGPIGPAGGPTGPVGPTGARGPQGIISFGSSTQGNMVIYNPTEPTKVSQTSKVQVDGLGNINITGDLVPTVAGSQTTGYNLGSVANPWKKLYVSQNTIEFVGTGSTGSIGLDNENIFYSTNGVKSTFFNVGPSGTSPDGFRGYSITSDTNSENLVAQKVIGTGTTGPFYGLNSWSVDNNNIYNSNSGNVGIGKVEPENKLDVFGITQLENNYQTNILNKITSNVIPSNVNPFTSVFNPNFSYYYFNDPNILNTFNYSGVSDNAVINIVLVGAAGGGGGGGYNTNYGGSGGGGGGSGQVTLYTTNLLAFKDYIINVGNGGDGGSAGQNISNYYSGNPGKDGKVSILYIGDNNYSSLGGVGGRGGGGSSTGVTSSGGGGNAGGWVQGSTIGQGGSGGTVGGYNGKNGTTTSDFVGGGGSAGWGYGYDALNSYSGAQGLGGTITATFADGSTLPTSVLLGVGGKAGGGKGSSSSGGGGAGGINGLGNGGQGGFNNGGNGGRGGNGSILIYFDNKQNVSTEQTSLIVNGNANLKFDVEIGGTILANSKKQINIGSYKEPALTKIYPLGDSTTHISCFACSDDGKYITIGSYYGYMYRSTDGGITFSPNINFNIFGLTSTTYYLQTSQSIFSSTRWRALAMSSTGQYQCAGIYYDYNGANNYNIYYSKDYGVNWFGYLYSYSGTFAVNRVAMDKTGQYTIVGSGPDNAHQNAWTIYNTNVGDPTSGSWKEFFKTTSDYQYISDIAINSDGLYAIVNLYNYGNMYLKRSGSGASATYGRTNITTGGSMNALAMSNDAKRITMGPVNTSFSLYYNGNPDNAPSSSSYDTASICINTIRLLNVPIPGRYYPNSISIDGGEGKCQIASTFGSSDNAILFTNDYGYTWYDIFAFNNIDWTHIQISPYVTSIKDLKFWVSSNKGLYYYDATQVDNINLNGVVNISSTCVANGFFTTSDYRIKKNIKNLDNENTIDILRPVKYFNELNKKIEYGFIAHEVQELIPELVEGEKDSHEMQRLNYTGLVPILVKKLQENDKTIKYLEERISKLEKKE